MVRSDQGEGRQRVSEGSSRGPGEVDRGEPMNPPAAGLALALLGCGRALAGPTAPVELKPLSRAQLCVTTGAIVDGAERRMSIESPKVRAVASGPTAPAVELRFTYLG